MEVLTENRAHLWAQCVELKPEKKKAAADNYLNLSGAGGPNPWV